MPDPSFHIDTPRLTLSHFISSRNSHCDLFVDLTNDPNVHVANGGIAAEIPDHETARKNIDLNNQEIDSTGYGRYIVRVKTPSSTSLSALPIPELLETYTKIGLVSMKLRRNPGAPTLPDVGFTFLTPFTGKGYATEAATALLKHFQEAKGQKQFLGYCHPENEKSKSTFRRMGWVDRGMRAIDGLAPGVGFVRGWVFSLGVEEEELEGVGIMPWLGDLIER
ncbi:hypothetical protein CC80DRAFT_210557 [Byssothecium circinans]|uniref:N-acetyltransferase domain-containing protein n=1 Tax=Byssothecium circinans TaxID=147558 RepID=A0A6A5TI31_9PLEO|nr:hypothetical protein CC80DRAFT_210557 [Byssothecium circinans]